MTSSTYEAMAATCNAKDRDVSFVITLFEKEGGPLTKRIALDGDGKPKSDGSRCKMSRGSMRRLRLTVSGLAQLYGDLQPNQALGYGQMRADIPDGAILRWKKSPEAALPGVYTRTRDCIDYRPGEPAAMLIDHDSGGMSDEVRKRIAAAGSVIAALEQITGDPVIHSFKHGGGKYVLRYDRAYIEATILITQDDAVIDTLCRMIHVGGDDCAVSPSELTALIDIAANRTGERKSDIRRRVAEAIKEKRERTKKAKKATRLAKEPRFKLPKGAPDDEIGPILRSIDAAMCAVTATEPPVRDLESRPIRVVEREPCNDLHELTSETVNGMTEKETRLPPPKQALFDRHDDCSLELELGQYIVFVQETESDVRFVAPHPKVVEHWRKYKDSCLPRVASIVTAPVILPDGKVLSENGLDRKRKMILRIDPALLPYIPTREQCTPESMIKAYEFLIDDWLCDVAGDLQSKTVLLAYALSVLQRALFSERPCFLITAGQRASGKTTVIRMLVMAVLGPRLITNS